MPTVGSKLVELGPVLGNIPINRLAVLQIKNDHLVDHDQWQRRKLTKKHLRSVPFSRSER